MENGVSNQVAEPLYLLLMAAYPDKQWGDTQVVEIPFPFQGWRHAAFAHPPLVQQGQGRLRWGEPGCSRGEDPGKAVLRQE